MREILFRGKRTGDGEWIYGNRLEDTIIATTCKTIFDEYGERSGFTFDPNWVDPETVGQYTGLTDKNGKKIFEGDIVKRFWLGAEKTYYIEYEEESACFIGNALAGDRFTTFDYDGEMFEIVGNIHDNQELLERGTP